jgi:hypothetical protein
MRFPSKIFFVPVIVGTVLLASCETIIDPKLQEADPVLVVDAWLTDKPGPQQIRLTRTQPYFETGQLTGVASAIVAVTNTTSGERFDFLPGETADQYTWTPSTPGETVGVPGDNFDLRVELANEFFVSSTHMGRAPVIDSIRFVFEPAGPFLPDMYLAEFWATDFPGQGDTYWIKAYKNDTLLLRPGEINIAFDAGFSEGGNFDGVTFITPKRRGINPQDFDEEAQLPLSPYAAGDSVYVEIQSISKEAFNFINQVVVQINRPGGFAELFAAPLANVSTNINNTNSAGSPVVGFFNVGQVTSSGKRLRE